MPTENSSVLIDFLSFYLCYSFIGNTKLPPDFQFSYCPVFLLQSTPVLDYDHYVRYLILSDLIMDGIYLSGDPKPRRSILLSTPNSLAKIEAAGFDFIEI